MKTINQDQPQREGDIVTKRQAIARKLNRNSARLQILYPKICQNLVWFDKTCLFTNCATMCSQVLHSNTANPAYTVGVAELPGRTWKLFFVTSIWTTVELLRLVHFMNEPPSKNFVNSKQSKLAAVELPKHWDSERFMGTFECMMIGIWWWFMYGPRSRAN